MLFARALLFLIVAMHEYVDVRLHFFYPRRSCQPRRRKFVLWINILFPAHRIDIFKTTLNKSRGRDFLLRGVVLWHPKILTLFCWLKFCQEIKTLIFWTHFLIFETFPFLSSWSFYLKWNTSQFYWTLLPSQIKLFFYQRD